MSDIDPYSSRFRSDEQRGAPMNSDDQPGQRGNIGAEIYEQVEKIIAEEGLSRTNAFQRISEMTGRRAGTVAANYYRVARQRGANLQGKRTRTKRTPRAPRAAAPKAASSARAGSGDADAALSRAMESLQELAGIVREQEKELSSLRAQAEQVEKLRGLLSKI